MKNETSDKNCILVLGMHRSGTSALTGLLNILGVDLGEDLLSNGIDNAKGHFENQKFLKINENILKIFGMNWDSMRCFPKSWYKNEEIQLIIDEIKKNIENIFFDGNIFAIKDPRLLKVFPIWEDALKSLNYNIKIVFVIRHPMEVALSLQKRNNMPLEKGLLLFTQDFLNGEAVSREYERVIVPFDDILKDTFSSLSSIEKQLKINFPKSIKAKQKEINNFLDTNLKHHNVKDNSQNHLQIAFEIYEFFKTLKFKQMKSSDIEIIEEFQKLYNEKYGRIVGAIAQEYDTLFQDHNKLLSIHTSLIEEYHIKQSSIQNAILIILSQTVGRIPILGNIIRSLWKLITKQKFS